MPTNDHVFRNPRRSGRADGAQLDVKLTLVERCAHERAVPVHRFVHGRILLGRIISVTGRDMLRAKSNVFSIGRGDTVYDALRLTPDNNLGAVIVRSTQRIESAHRLTRWSASRKGLARLRIDSNHTLHVDSSVAPPPVRFLSAVAAVNGCNLLMALNCGSGEPDFWQLEPDGELPKAASRAPRSR